MVFTETISLKTKGFCDIINITLQVFSIVKPSPVEKMIEKLLAIKGGWT